MDRRRRQSLGQQLAEGGGTVVIPPELAIGKEKYGKAPAFLQHTASRVRGHVEITGPLLSGQVPEGDTLMCVHCQKHWVIQPGSGIHRGFCFRCAGPTCGKRLCETRCVPFEKAIEMMER